MIRVLVLALLAMLVTAGPAGTAPAKPAADGNDVPDVVLARERWLEAVLHAEELGVAAAVALEQERLGIEAAVWIEEHRPKPAPARTGVTTSSGAGGVLADIRACESTGNYAAVDPSGTYRGAYQFDYQTWAGVGGTGDPAAASPAEQDYRAGLLYAERGRAPWPNC